MCSLAVSEERRAEKWDALVSASNLLSFGILPHLQLPSLLLGSLAWGLGAQTQEALAAVEDERRAIGEGKPKVSLDTLFSKARKTALLPLSPFPTQPPPFSSRKTLKCCCWKEP